MKVIYDVLNLLNALSHLHVLASVPHHEVVLHVVKQRRHEICNCGEWNIVLY